MSCRHPVKNESAGTKDTKVTKATKDRTDALPFVSLVTFVSSVFLVLIRNGGHLPRIERREELACPFQIELRVGGLDAEEEPVPARQREAWHVEHRVIWLRQPVQRQHAQHRGERCDENRALERHRDERVPAVKRLH